MMSETFRLFLAAGLAATLCGRPLRADPMVNETEGTTEKAAVAEQKAGTTADGQGDQPAASRMALMRDRLRRLHESLHSKLELFPEQKASIDRAFGEYLHHLAEIDEPLLVYRTMPTRGDRIAELRDEMIAARKSGENKKLELLKARFVDHIRERERLTALAMEPFLSRVSLHLDRQQIETFESLVRKLGLHDPIYFLDRRLQPTRRIAFNPLVGATTGQRLRFRWILVSGTLRIAEAEASGESVDAIVEAVREAVLAELDLDQRQRAERLAKYGPPTIRKAGEPPRRLPAAELKATRRHQKPGS